MINNILNINIFQKIMNFQFKLKIKNHKYIQVKNISVEIKYLNQKLFILLPLIIWILITVKILIIKKTFQQLLEASLKKDLSNSATLPKNNLVLEKNKSPNLILSNINKDDTEVSKDSNIIWLNEAIKDENNAKTINPNNSINNGKNNFAINENANNDERENEFNRRLQDIERREIELAKRESELAKKEKEFQEKLKRKKLFISREQEISFCKKKKEN